MTATTPKHPAKFSATILGVLNTIMEVEATRQQRPLLILDPMAGVGRVHELDRNFVRESIGVEIEAEWAATHPCTERGDVLNLSARWVGTFDAVVTSPPYGNRMADHHNARDGSRRMTYKHQLGHDLTEGSGAAMQWGADYKLWAGEVTDSMATVIKPGGLMVLNISNHIRKGKEMLVSEWWLGAMLACDMQLERAVPVPTPRMRFGKNHQARVQQEWVFVMRQPS